MDVLNNFFAYICVRRLQMRFETRTYAHTQAHTRNEEEICATDQIYRIFCVCCLFLVVVDVVYLNACKIVAVYFIY